MSRLVEYPAGARVFRQGERCSSVYVVLRGTVAIDIDLPGQPLVTIQEVGRGELLGWSPLLRIERMTATARTLTPCRLAELNAAEILRYSERDPQFGMEFLRRTAIALSERLAATRRQLAGKCLTGGGP
jgi:CRP-like cAMP-binding protein